MILLRSSLNYFRQHYFQSLLAIIGIAIGISITVAIDLAIVSSKKSFELSASRVVGEASHQITSSNSEYLDEDIYRKLKTDLAINKAAPVVEGFVIVQNKALSDDNSSIIRKQGEKQVIRILGLDPFAEKNFRDLSILKSGQGSLISNKKNQAFLSKKTADNIGVKPGESFRIRVGSLTKNIFLVSYIKDTSSSYENLALMDISTAQEILGLIGKLSYINLKAKPDGIFDNSKKGISQNEFKALLGEGLEVQRSAARSDSVKQMTESFNLNLTALSFLALIVAIFLIYNSMSFSIVQRRKLIAILKSLGTSRKQILVMIFIEALIFSIIGIGLGLALGIILGKSLMGFISQTINDIYFTLEINKFSISSFSLLKGAALGLLASLTAAVFPALDASSSSPLIAMSRSGYESKSTINFRKLFITGIGLIILASLILKLSSGIILSFTGLFFILLGFSFLTPLIVKAFTKTLQPLYKTCFGFIGSLSLKSISSQLSRTSIAIATLMIAISMSIGLNITIKSFRDTVENWLSNSLKADVYISAPRLVSNKADKSLEAEFVNSLVTEFTDDIKEVLTYKNTELMSNLGLINLASIKTSNTVRALMQNKDSIQNFWERFTGLEDLVLISEPFAYKNKLKAGDAIILNTQAGKKKFIIASVFVDFGSDKGVVMMADKIYQAYFNDYSISSLGILIKDSKNQAERIQKFINDVKSKYSKDYALFIRSNYDLKQESLTVFDRTFKVTNVLKWIAILVAFIAVFSAFMSLQLERTREFAVLRANGVSPKQISFLLLLQTITMGSFAAILAIPVGLIQAFVMIFIINQRSFGWSLELSLDKFFFLEALIYSLLASSLAVIYPIYITNSSKISEALRYE